MLEGQTEDWLMCEFETSSAFLQPFQFQLKNCVVTQNLRKYDELRTLDDTWKRTWASGSSRLMKIKKTFTQCCIQEYNI